LIEIPVIEYAYYVVETPWVFREAKLQRDAKDFSKIDKREYERLQDLAESHGASIQI